MTNNLKEINDVQKIIDGFLADAYMQSKIMSSLKELKNLRSTLLNLKSKLSNLSNNYYK